MKLSNQSKIVIVIFSLCVLFWISLFFIKNQDQLENLRRFTQLPLVIIPLIGGLFGVKNARNWGGVKSVLGRSVLGISVGLLGWAGAMIIWNYYLFFTAIEVPYPSLADALFILVWPLWIYSVLQLYKAIGTRFALKQGSNKLALYTIAILSILLSVYLTFGVAREWNIVWDGDWLKLFFDLYYPIGDIVMLVIIILAYWLSKNFLGGIYKIPIVVLFSGFFLNYLADVIFTFTTSKETYFNGHFVDFIYLLGMFALSLGVSMLNSKVLDNKTKMIN